MKNGTDIKLTPYRSITLSSFNSNEGLLEVLLRTEITVLRRRIDKPIVLYGAGSLGKMAKTFFDYFDIPFLYVVDKNANQYGMDNIWTHVKIVHPDEVKTVDKKTYLLIICIATTPLIALHDALKADGWEDIAFFYDVCETYSARYPLTNGWFLNTLGKHERDAIKKVFFVLDEMSRMHYLQFLAWRKLRIELLFEHLEITDTRFFIPGIINSLNENEVFVDCGAHIGKVTKNFISITNNRYRKIYAIDADKENFALLKNNVINVPDCKTIQCALGNKNGKRNFYQGFDFLSRLHEDGNDTVRVKILDAFDIPATFIKMHLEGGELDALHGAVNTIQQHRPLVAVTMYHNSDGVWKIPHFFINNVQDYVFYMRMHSWAGTVAVFYAIPKERVTMKQSRR